MPALQRSQGNGPDDKATDNFAACITIQGPSVIADLRALAVGGGGGGGGGEGDQLGERPRGRHSYTGTT